MKNRYLFDINDPPPHTLSVLSAIAKTYRPGVSIEERSNDAYNYAMSRVDDSVNFLGIDNMFKDKESIENMVVEIDGTIDAIKLPNRRNRFNVVARWGRGYKRTLFFMEHNWDA